MTCRIKVAMDNAAFDGDGMGDELARILRAIADETSGQGESHLSYTGWILHDANGNAVGSVSIDGREDG